jgi:hypothetical protein
MDKRNSNSLAAPQFASVVWMTIFLVAFAVAIMVHPLGTAVALATMLVITVGLIKPEYLIYGSILFLSISALELQLLLRSFEFKSTLLPIPMFLAFMFWQTARLAKLIPILKYITSLDLLVLATWFFATISMAWTPHPEAGLLVLLHLTICMMYYFVLTRLIQTREQIGLCFRFWWILGIIVLLEILFSFFKGYRTNIYWYDFLGFDSITLNFSMQKYDGTRETLRVLGANPKNIPILLNLAIICVTIFLFLTKKIFYRILICIFLVFMFVVHLLASARVEMGGLFLGWMYILLRNPTWRSKFLRYQVYLAGLILLSVGLSLLVVSQYSQLAMADFLSRYGIGESYTMRGGTSGHARLDLFKMGIEALYQTGGIGYGIGGIMPEVEPTLTVNLPSIPLSFLFDHGYGLLSLILCSWLYLNIALEVRRALRVCQNQPYFYYLLGIAWIMIAFGAASLLDHQFVQEYYWFVLGFCMAGVQAAYLPGVSKNDLEQDLNMSSGELNNKGNGTYPG